MQTLRQTESILNTKIRIIPCFNTLKLGGQRGAVWRFLNFARKYRGVIVTLTNAVTDVIPRFILFMESICLLCKQMHL